jgi:hypothetical protein
LITHHLLHVNLLLFETTLLASHECLTSQENTTVLPEDGHFLLIYGTKPGQKHTTSQENMGRLAVLGILFFTTGTKSL